MIEIIAWMYYGSKVSGFSQIETVFGAKKEQLVAFAQVLACKNEFSDERINSFLKCCRYISPEHNRIILNLIKAYLGDMNQFLKITKISNKSDPSGKNKKPASHKKVKGSST